MVTPLLLALCSNVVFATASLFFAEYSRRVSSLWMNFYKAVVACFAFLIVCTIFQLWQIPATKILGLLFGSGILGLMVGDIFLLKAFTHLGSGRTLMIFGFQPLILGIASQFLFHQDFSSTKLIAIIFLILCGYSFALESFRTKGHWDIPGLIFAVLGVTLDAGGLLMTRAAFEENPSLSPFFVNFLRALAASSGFFLLSRLPRFRLSFLQPKGSFSRKDWWTVTGASLLGTFLSLSFYLMAVKVGHLASISAVAGTSPLFATLFETIRGKKSFSGYLLFGVGCFLAGFVILLLF